MRKQETGPARNAYLTSRVGHVAESGARVLATKGYPELKHERFIQLYVNNWEYWLEITKRSAFRA